MSGSLRCSAAALIMVVAGLLANAQVMPMATATATTNAYLVALPHFTYGGTWKTVFIVRNTGTTATDVDIHYFGNDGNPLSVPINGVSVTHTTVTVPGNGEREVIPDSSGSAEISGWAGLVFTTTDISAQAVFLWNNKTEAVAPIISRMPAMCILPFPPSNISFTMPFDNTGGKFSGYGLANSTNAAVTVDLKFFDENGQQVGEFTEPLVAYGHDQFLLTNHLPQLKDKKGTMQINGAGVVPLGFRFSPAGTFTTWLP